MLVVVLVVEVVPGGSVVVVVGGTAVTAGAIVVTTVWAITSLSGRSSPAVPRPIRKAAATAVTSDIMVTASHHPGIRGSWGGAGWSESGR